MLMWVRSKDEDFNNIEKIQLCYICKEKILEYLKSNGFNKETVNVFNEKGYLRGNRKYYNLTKDIKLVQSLNTCEKSINIIIKKEILFKLADKVITKKY